MAYRVYDTESKKWIKDNIYLSPDGELFLVKQSVFGWCKVPLALSQDRYVYHIDAGLYDKNNELVYEGDYILANINENKNVVGLVTYAHEMSAYIILCDDNMFYTLGSNVCDLIEIIGNVFDGYEVNEDGEQTLQGQEV